MAAGLTRALLVATIAAGVFLRFDGRARRWLWCDEARARGPADVAVSEWERVVVAPASPALDAAVATASGPTPVLTPIATAPGAPVVAVAR